VLSSLEKEYKGLKRNNRKLEGVTVLEQAEKQYKTEYEKAFNLMLHFSTQDVLPVLAKHVLTHDELKNCSRTGQKKC
jgi:hypothetical protein